MVYQRIGGNLVTAAVPRQMALDPANVRLAVAVLALVGRTRDLVAAGLAFGGLGHGVLR